VEIEQLATAAKKGNAEAFTTLMSSQQERLYRIAYAYLHNEADALEAIQETTYRAFNKINKLKDPALFSTWIIRILLNYCSDERKRNQRFSSKEALPESSSLDHTEDFDLTSALGELDSACKQVIILKYYEGFTLTEIGLILESPTGTIKTRLHRALEQLREKFGTKGDQYYV
jgi:RNA polymerase sigma-70 factor (TIGR02954 family)